MIFIFDCTMKKIKENKKYIIIDLYILKLFNVHIEELKNLMSFKYHIALNFVLKKLFWGHKVVQQDYRISEAQKNYKNQGKIFCALPQKI